MEKTKIDKVVDSTDEMVDMENDWVNSIYDNADAEKIIEKGQRYLTFEIEKESYGVKIEYVIEIIGIQDITKLPGMPNYVKGLINLRGKIIPLIDAREKFGKNKIDYNDRTCVIVLEVEEIMVGLVVDIISDVITIKDSDIEDAPNIGKIKTNKYIKEIAKTDRKVRLLIDCEKLIND